MALSDLLKDLDPKYASALSEAADSLRREFDQKLSATRAELGLEAAPAAVLEEAPAAPPTTAAPPQILDPVEELKHAVVAIDGAGSQGEILGTLVAGCARFASRCAVFLVRDGKVGGWTSHGFSLSDDDMRSVSFAVEPDSPWESISRGEGTLALGSAECGPLCEKLGGEAPEMGLLLPFVLNNQTAAGVYCDRVAGDEPPNLAALQLVTFVASQVLENLPVRDRDSTSTLRLADASFVPVAAPDISVEPEIEAPPAEPPVVYEDQEISAVEEIEEEVEFAPPMEAAVEIEAPADDAATGFEAYEIETQLAAEPATTDALFEPEAPAATPAEVSLPAAPIEPEPPAEPSVPLGEEPPAPAILSDATTQVAPPSDLEGPGWAFAGPSATTPDAGDDTQHEEARRLARLLVTEVKLYNEELVEQGRKKGDVYSVLKEDIDRSRQIFEDRIAKDVRARNDYFHEALVRILAGGDPSILGA